MKQYPPEVYTELVKLIRDDDADSRKWLNDMGCREWVEFCDANDGQEKAFQWLMQNGHRAFAATIDALSGNDSAKVFLIRSGQKELAAFVDASRGNKSAVAILLRLQQKGLIQIAHELYLRNKKEEKKSFWSFLNFGNPFR